MISQRKGIYLVEMVVAMMVYIVIMAIGTVVLLASMQMEQYAAQALGQTQNRMRLADQFRADVRSAGEAPLAWGNYKADVDCLILMDAAGRHVVYRWSPGSLERTVADADKEVRQVLPIGPHVVDVQFDWAKGPPAIATLRIVDQTGSNKVRRETSIAAQLGGDTR